MGGSESRRKKTLGRGGGGGLGTRALPLPATTLWRPGDRKRDPCTASAASAYSLQNRGPDSRFSGVEEVFNNNKSRISDPFGDITDTLLSPSPFICRMWRCSFFFLFFFFNCRFEAAAGELGEELGSRRVTEPTRSPASSLSHPQPAAAADGPDPPHLLSPVFSRPVLAARSQGRRLRGGREPGRRGRKPEPLDCYYWSRGVAVEKHV